MSVFDLISDLDENEDPSLGIIEEQEKRKAHEKDIERSRDAINRLAEKVILHTDSLSPMDVARYWKLWQETRKSSSCLDDELLGIITVDLCRDEPVFARLMAYLENHPYEFEFSDKAEELRDINDEEKQFIENHKNELLERCPIDLSSIKERCQQAKKGGLITLQVYYYFLYRIGELYGHYPQAWKAMSKFPEKITPAKAIKALESLNNTKLRQGLKFDEEYKGDIDIADIKGRFEFYSDTAIIK